MTFEDLNLNKQLLNALADMNIEEPTAIQTKAFPVVMSGRDVVGIAQTGTGKTFAYLLPLLRLHTFSKQHDPRVLIVVPTRELVLQVVSEIEKLCEYMNVRVAGVYGGTNMNTQRKVFDNGLDILVGTPGRLIDFAMSGAVKFRSIKKLVIDEVDEMLELGFRKQLSDIIHLLPDNRQSLLFSATITKDVNKIIAEYFRNPVRIEAAASGTPLDKIRQTGYSLPNFYSKVNFIVKMLDEQEEMSKVLVFAPNKNQADLLHERLSEQFEDQIGVIHSNKSQNYRINALKQFEEGTYRVLIATDLVARGLDLSDVTHVINLDTPVDPNNYIHRIGRTGRADKEGDAILLTTDKEEPFKLAIEEMMKLTIPVADLPENLELSEEMIDEEMPEDTGVNYLAKAKKVERGPGVHEKKAKNKKVNLGGKYRREIKQKYKKPKTRGQKRK